MISNSQLISAKEPKAVQLLDHVGKQLQAIYGTAGVPVEELKRAVEKLAGYRKDSVLPSDYCYNIINRAAFSFEYPLFERVGRGRYRYLGAGYAYDGAVLWKPKGEAERQVGFWKAGVCTLTEDPRQL